MLCKFDFSRTSADQAHNWALTGKVLKCLQEGGDYYNLPSDSMEGGLEAEAEGEAVAEARGMAGGTDRQVDSIFCGEFSEKPCITSPFHSRVWNQCKERGVWGLRHQLYKRLDWKMSVGSQEQWTE